MNYIEIFVIALAVSMDTFAMAIYKGLNLKKADLRNALIVGAYFTSFQVLMPLAGYYAATMAAGSLSSFEWIAFALLCLLGIRMIIEGLRNNENKCNKKGESLHPFQMVPIAFVVGIDAMAVGVSFAFLEVNIISAVALLGITALMMAMIGVRIGRRFGRRIGSRAELFGGAVLILIGLTMLL